MKKNTLLLCAALLFCACGSSDRIVFSGRIDAGEPKPLTATVLNEEFEFSNPWSLVVLDSVLVVLDTGDPDGCIHMFRKTDGAHLKTAVKRGRGPGEVVMPHSIVTNYDGRSVTTIDANLCKVIVFDIANILRDAQPWHREYLITATPSFVNLAISRGDSFVIGAGDDKMRFGMWNPSDNSVSNIYTGYQPLTDDEEANWAIMNYCGWKRLSPDRSKLVCTTYVGGMMEIFDVGDEGFTPSSAHFYFEPVFDYFEGTQPRGICPNDDTVIGFEDLALTNECIFGVVRGKALSDIGAKVKIYRFDYDGTPIDCYDPVNRVERIAVDEDNTIYALGQNSHGDYRLVRYDGVTD